MMMESISPEQTRVPKDGEHWRRSAWLVLIASGLVVAAGALVWWDDRRVASTRHQLDTVGELQLMARDITVLSSIAVAGDRAALQQLRERTEILQSAVTALINGGIHNGRIVAPAADDVQARLSEFSVRWADFRHRTDTLLAAAAPAAKPLKDASPRRGADQRSPAAPPQKAAAARAGRGAEAGAAVASVLSAGYALATPLDGIRTELQARTAQVPWLTYLGLACAFAALVMLATLLVSIRQSAAAMRRSAVELKTSILDGLRPAMRTLRIEAGADALADPTAFGRRLSDEMLAVIDGIKVLVKALDTATAEADKFAVVGHIAAQALVDAEQRAAQTGTSLQTTVRRIAAVCATLSASAREVQQQATNLLGVVGTALTAVKDAAGAAERLRKGMDGISENHARTVAMNTEIQHGLSAIADLLMQAEGYALRAADRPPGSGADEAAAVARDVRSYLGPSASMLKQAIELVQRHGREADACSNALAQTALLAVHPSRAALDASHALGHVEAAMGELSAKIASMSRLASPVEVSQLLSALDEIVDQVAQSSASARRVIDATKNAASHIEELAKLLNTMKPS